jgi:DNA-binding GntR family transcriptional regulator
VRRRGIGTRVVQPKVRRPLGLSSLYEVIRAAGIQLHAADQSIGARRATPEEARLLGEPRSAALLTMQRTTYDDHGRVVEYGNHLYAASRYSFEHSMLAG